MFEQIRDILSKYTEETITTESAFAADLGLSSFDVVSIVTDFEERFDIEIPDRDIRRFISVKDVMNYLSEHT